MHGASVVVVSCVARPARLRALRSPAGGAVLVPCPTMFNGLVTLRLRGERSVFVLVLATCPSLAVSVFHLDDGNLSL